MFSRFGPIYIYGPLFIPFVLDTFIILYTILERKNRGKISKKSLAFVWWNSTYKIFYNIWARLHAFIIPSTIWNRFQRNKMSFSFLKPSNNLWLDYWTSNKKIPRFCLPRFFHFLLCTWIGLVVFFSLFCLLFCLLFSLDYHKWYSIWCVFCKQWPDQALNTFKDLQRRQRGEWSTRQVYIEHWTCINLTYWKGTFVSKSD